jgi:signal transduction histidine kinase
MPAAPRARRLPSLFKSAAFRFALLYAVLFGISAVALAFFVWWQTAGLLRRQTVAAITADVQGLAEQWSQGGTPALILTIRQRLAANPNDKAIYLLADPSYRYVAGNLVRWPGAINISQELYEVALERDGVRSLASVYRFDLPDGFHMLVGRDAELGEHMRRLLGGALLWAGLVVVVLGGAGAVIVRGVFRRALAGVFATATAISAGDLARRVPRTGRGDEFDSLAETINDMLDRINRLMDGVRHVSDSIAHDLRTPITRARVRLEDAAQHAQGPDDLRAAIERAETDLDGVVAVFQALLRISEIESGARRSAFDWFDLSSMLRDLAEFYDALAEDGGCTLLMQVPETPMLLGDAALVQQAVSNLIENALKYSPENSTVTLSVATGPDLCITVADRGPGMTDQDRDRATERFFRAEAARNTPGSGLGLSLVEAVAHLHGGRLVLRDNDPGLLAEIRLPMPGGQPPPRALPARAA